MSDPLKHHSRYITDGPDRAPAGPMLKAVGFTNEDLARPLVGVAYSWIEVMPYAQCARPGRARQGRYSRRLRDAD